MPVSPSHAPLPHAMPQAEALLDTPIARYVWRSRYRTQAETSVEATWERVAGGVAGAEAVEVALWRQRFFDLLRDFQFVAGGRIAPQARAPKAAAAQ